MEEEGKTYQRTSLSRVVSNGVYHPKTKEQEIIANLENEIVNLKTTLETERARQFRNDESKLTQKQQQEADASKELAQMSRKLNEDRVRHKEQLQQARATVIAQVQEQVSKRKGDIFSSLNETFMGILQSQLNAKEGELYERAVIATKATVENDVLEKKGIVYERLLHGAKEDVKKECALRQGEIFNSLESDIRASIYKELHDKQEEERQRIEEIERSFHLRYMNAVEEMKNKFQLQHDTLRGELEKHIVHQRRQFTDSYSNKVDEVDRQWLEKWGAREVEWLDKLRALELERVERDRCFTDGLATKTENSVNALIQASTDCAQTALERLGGHLENLEATEKRHLQDLGEKVAHGVRQLEGALQLHNESIQRNQEVEKERYTAQLGALEELFNEERTAYQENLKSMQATHESERAQMKHVIESEQLRVSSEKTHFETEIRAQYELLGQSLKEQHRLEMDKTSEKHANLVSQEATFEATKRSITTQAMLTAEQATHDKWETIIREKEEQWKKDEAERRELLTNQLESRFAVRLAEMQDRLDALGELREHGEQVWAEKQVEIGKETALREERFKKVTQAIFEKRMDKFMHEYDSHLNDMHDKLFQQAAVHAENRAQLEMRTVAMQGEMEKWKITHAAQLEEKMHQKVLDMQRAHTAEIAQFAEQLRKTREELRVFQELHEKEIHRAVRDRVDDSSALFEIRRKLKHDQELQIAGSKVLESHKERILGLWSTMKLSVCDYAPFLLNLFRNVEFSPKLQALLEEQIQLLNTKLPILKLATQREQLKHQVRALNNSPRRDSLLNQISTLTATLEKELAKFRRKFPRQVVLFNGEDYGSVIKNDAINMPDIILAKGTVRNYEDNA